MRSPSSSLRVPLLRGLALLGALSAISCDSGTGPGGPGEPASLQIVSGNEQEGVVGRQLGDPLVVRVVDDEGRAIQGQLVNFVVTSGGGSVFAGSGISNAQGIVQERWTLGTSTAVEQRVEARAVDNETGDPIVFATFTAVADPDAPASLEKIAGDGASGVVGTVVTPSPGVRVEDQYGNPVPAISVTFAVASGGGSLGGGQVMSGHDGRATVGTWTLGLVSGAQTLTASAPGVPSVTFTVNAGPAAASSLAFVTPPPSSVASGATLPAVVVELRDPHGNRVPQTGVSITVVLAEGEGTLGGPATAHTDAAGRATFSSLVLSGAAGPRTLIFTAPSLTSLTSQPIALTAGSAAGMAKHAGDNQQIVVGGSASPAPAVRITDASGNPISGVTVTFAIAAGGGALSDATATTNEAGIAAVGGWTVGTATGPARLEASAPALGTVTFEARIIAGPPASITKHAGDGQTAPAGTAVQVPPAVLVQDAHGNPVPDAAVVFAVTSGGGSVTGDRVTTTAQGIATAGAWTLGTTVGSQTVEAAVQSLPVVFTATASLGTGRVLTKISGDLQTGVGRETLPDPIRVRATDQFGNPRAGVPLSVFVDNGDGDGGITFVGGSNVTDANGYVTMSWRLGTRRESQQLRVYIENALSTSVFFTATMYGANANAVTAGGGHACAASGDRTFCWGENGSGQLGNGSPGNGTDSRTPVQTEGTPAFTGLEAGGNTTWGLSTGGTVYQWGANRPAAPIRSEVLFVRIALGYALTGAGELFHVVDTMGFTPLATDLRFTHVTQGWCGIATDQRGFCQGSNLYGELGNGTFEGSSTPREIAGGHRFIDLSRGTQFACGVTTEGRVLCWGRNTFGQIGQSDRSINYPTPVPVAGLEGVTARKVTAGDNHACAIDEAGMAYCWGRDAEGQVGDGGGENDPRTSARRVVGDRRFTEIDAGQSFTCALGTLGSGPTQVYCWGLWERVGVLGFTAGNNADTPQLVFLPPEN